jgi:hypothetical protein
MKRRHRTWTKGRLLEDPQKHPILALWDRPEVVSIMKERGEDGLHFNDMRHLLCKDFNQIKRPSGDWNAISVKLLGQIRIYNNYTILQKDLTKLCEIGFLKKKARGYYEHVERPVMRYIRDLSLSGQNLVGSTEECDILASEDIDLDEEVEMECEKVYTSIQERRAHKFESRILTLWQDIDASDLDLPQKIVLKGELNPFTRSARLKKLIKRRCLVTTEKGKQSYEMPLFKKRHAGKLKACIDIANRYADSLGNLSVKFAVGMYTFPSIFNEDYIAKKGADFRGEMKPFFDRIITLIVEFENPCYILLAPRQ